MSFLGLKVNSPPVVGAVGLTCVAALPFLKGTFEKKSIPWVAVQGVNLCAFGISFWRVTQPGRSDAQSKKASEKAPAPPATATATPQGKSKKKKKAAVSRVRTLFPPDGWSFVIWAPIFVGECLMVGTQVALPKTSPLVPIIREITGPYIFAKAFQILWTTSFQPEFTQGAYKYIAALNLSGIALSLSFCHQAYTNKAARDKYTMMDFLLNFLPLSLHFGWTTVTSLVNWNASCAIEKDVSTKHLSYLGHLSVVAATVAGTGITLMRKAPLYGTVIAWALAAVASGLSKRIDGAEQEKRKDEAFLEAAKRQKLLSIAGATLCGSAALWAAFGTKRTSSR